MGLTGDYGAIFRHLIRPTVHVCLGLLGGCAGSGPYGLDVREQRGGLKSDVALPYALCAGHPKRHQGVGPVRAEARRRICRSSPPRKYSLWHWRYAEHDNI